MSESINTLPVPLNSPQHLLSIILPAFDREVAKFENLQGESLYEAELPLRLGAREGAFVEGVDTIDAARMLLQRLASQGVKSSPFLDRKGRMVYRFSVPFQYMRRKGNQPPHSTAYTSYVTVETIYNRAPLELRTLVIAEDLDPKTGLLQFRFQGPQAKHIRSFVTDIITVILSADGQEFLAWFPGEPIQTYNENNAPALLTDDNGEFRLNNVWVHLGRDYEKDSKEVRDREQRKHWVSRHGKTKKQKPSLPQHPSQHERVPLNDLAKVLDEAYESSTVTLLPPSAEYMTAEMQEKLGV